MKHNSHLKRINSFRSTNKPIACKSCDTLAKQNLKQLVRNHANITNVLSNFKFPDIIVTSLESIPKTIVMSNCKGCGNGEK